MALDRRFTTYLPALDGLRAVAILLVVLSHLGLGRIVPGAFGVTLFFFISGYLITRQLLGGMARHGRLDFKGFYLRRCLRLMPQAVTYIVVAGLVYSALGGRITAAGWAAALLYGANGYDLVGHYGPTLPGVRHPFNILWSLAIEEQFYLLWPVALVLLPARCRLPGCLLFCATVLCWRFWLLHHCFGGHAPLVCGPENPNPLWRYNRLYLATDARADSLAWGALLALAEQGGLRWRAPRAGLLILALAFAWPGPVGRHVLRPALQGLGLLACFPTLLNADSPLHRLLSSRPAILLGRLSYALYLWHWGALGAADYAAGDNPTLWLAIAIALSAALTLFSYAAIEQPMLRLRRLAGSHVPRNATEAAAAGAPTVAERAQTPGQGTHAAT